MYIWEWFPKFMWKSKLGVALQMWVLFYSCIWWCDCTHHTCYMNTFHFSYWPLFSASCNAIAEQYLSITFDDIATTHYVHAILSKLDRRRCQFVWQHSTIIRWDSAIHLHETETRYKFCSTRKIRFFVSSVLFVYVDVFFLSYFCVANKGISHFQ